MLLELGLGELCWKIRTLCYDPILPAYYAWNLISNWPSVHLLTDFEVGISSMAISEPLKLMGNFKVYTCKTFNKTLGQTATSAWKYPKCNFWGPLTITEILNPLQEPTQTLTPSSMNARKTMYGFNMACIELYATRPNSITLKSKDLATRAFSNKLQTHPPKPAETEPSFSNVSLPPAKLHTYAFFAHLWVREFWPQTYFLWQALDLGLLSKF